MDILTYVALKLSGLPEKRVLGSGTVLDTARLKYALGEHLGVDSRSVHSFIIGEHGDSEIAAWSSTNVSGIPLNEFCENDMPVILAKSEEDYQIVTLGELLPLGFGPKNVQ